jgi:hypothetical protein
MAVTLYQLDNAGGVGLSSHDSIRDLTDWGFNDKASSISVTGQAAVFYEDVNFGGHSWTLQPGKYTNAELHQHGIPDNTISSFVA